MVFSKALKDTRRHHKILGQKKMPENGQLFLSSLGEICQKMAVILWQLKNQ
jgi:hypothetical protein